MSFKNKQARKDDAISHLAFVQTEYAQDIHKSIIASKIYEDRSCHCRSSVDGAKTLHIVDVIDAVSAVEKYQDQGNIALLDFASFKNPGGGFMNGSLAQEEAICSESTLYPILQSFEGSYYEPNRRNVNRSLYSSRSIYVPDVVFFHGENEIATGNVIVTAAPNRGAALNVGATEDECRTALKERIDAVMSIAANNEVDVLITGAFGCGVFKNDPYVVAQMFKTWCDEHSGIIKTVVYAIPSAGDHNLSAFQKVFS